MRFPRLTVAIVPPVPAWADVGPFEAVVNPHPYLHCFGHGCGERLWHGDTFTGAPILVCRRCQVIVDTRRVA